MVELGTIDRSTKTFVAGHRGMVGSAVWRHLHAAGFTNLVGTSSAELDLRDDRACRAYFREHRPKMVVLAAAKVGGILANDTFPTSFLSDNVRIQVNVLDAAVEQEVERLLFLGSSCIYPKLAAQPIKEESLLTGPLESTNDAYAIAKITGIYHVQAIRREYGLPYISAMPTNLYGPGDNYHPTNSHVVASLIRRYHEAKLRGAETLTNWGTGSPRREFLHVDDLARACLFLLENYDDARPINVGVGQDITVRELAATVADVVGYEGDTLWDASKPDGTPRKLLDVSRIVELGWRHRIGLHEGLTETYRQYAHSVPRGLGLSVSGEETFNLQSR